MFNLFFLMQTDVRLDFLIQTRLEQVLNTLNLWDFFLYLLFFFFIVISHLIMGKDCCTLFFSVVIFVLLIYIFL
jgi:hypothetical protein